MWTESDKKRISRYTGITPQPKLVAIFCMNGIVLENPYINIMAYLIILFDKKGLLCTMQHRKSNHKNTLVSPLDNGGITWKAPNKLYQLFYKFSSTYYTSI